MQQQGALPGPWPGAGGPLRSCGRHSHCKEDASVGRGGRLVRYVSERTTKAPPEEDKGGEGPSVGFRCVSESDGQMSASGADGEGVEVTRGTGPAVTQKRGTASLSHVLLTRHHALFFLTTAPNASAFVPLGAHPKRRPLAPFVWLVGPTSPFPSSTTTRTVFPFPMPSL